jgi:arylsulfatase B
VFAHPRRPDDRPLAVRFGLMRAVVPPWSKYGLPPAEKTLAELLAPAGYARRGRLRQVAPRPRPPRVPAPRSRASPASSATTTAPSIISPTNATARSDWHHDDRSVREEGYATDLLADHAARFIRESPAGQPWLIYLPFNAPHSPVPGQARRPRPKYPQLEGDRRTYAAMVDAMDQAIGRVLAAVEARPDAANTLVLFCSDNGGIPRVGSSNAPWRGAKLTVYEGGTRVAPQSAGPPAA